MAGTAIGETLGGGLGKSAGAALRGAAARVNPKPKAPEVEDELITMLRGRDPASYGAPDDGAGVLAERATEAPPFAVDDAMSLLKQRLSDVTPSTPSATSARAPVAAQPPQARQEPAPPSWQSGPSALEQIAAEQRAARAAMYPEDLAITDEALGSPRALRARAEREAFDDAVGRDTVGEGAADDADELRAALMRMRSQAPTAAAPAAPSGRPNPKQLAEQLMRMPAEQRGPVIQAIAKAHGPDLARAVAKSAGLSTKLLGLGGR